LLKDPSVRKEIVQGARKPPAPYFPRRWSPSGVTLIQQCFKNVIRDLCCCKQTVYWVSESAFFLFFFRQANGSLADRVLQSYF